MNNTSVIEFNGKQIIVIPLSSIDKPVRGELIKTGRNNFFLKTKDGLLVSNHIGGRNLYIDGYFDDQPQVLNALKKFGFVTATDIKEYKKWSSDRRKRHQKHDYAKRLLESADKIGIKLTSEQIEELNNIIL